MKQAKRFKEGESVGLDVIDDETGALSTSKRNPETGELYNPSGNVTPRESKTDSAPKATPAPTKTDSAPKATPAPIKKDTETSSVKKLTKEEGEKIAAKSKAAESSKPKSSGEKTYRTLSGKIEKISDEEPAGMEKLGKQIGRGVSDFFGAIRERGKKSNPDAYASGGMASASRRGDGIAQRGKTRGKMC